MIRVREFGYLLRSASTRERTSLDHAYLDSEDFDVLRDTLGGDSDGDNQTFLRFASRKREGCDAMQVLNHLGVIAVGQTQVEILPKIVDADIDATREVLWKMLYTVHDTLFREAVGANLSAGDNLLECFIGAFLSKLTRLVKRGLRSAYVVREENLLYLKGRLLVNANLRHNLVLRHRFYVAHDDFVTNRPENRLLHAALLKVQKLSCSLDNRRLCRELRLAFADVPATVRGSVGADLDAWRLDRGAAHYDGMLEWCRLLLKDEPPMPNSGADDHR